MGAWAGCVTAVWWLCPSLRAWEQFEGAELNSRVPLGLCSKFQARFPQMCCSMAVKSLSARERNKSAAFRGIFFISKHVISVLWQNNPPSAF